MERFLFIQLLSGGEVREEVIQTRIPLSSRRKGFTQHGVKSNWLCFIAGQSGVSVGRRNLFADATGCSAGKLYSIMV